MSSPQRAYGKVPLSFEPNVGQTAAPVDYLAHTGNATVFLTPTAAVFAMQPVGQAASLPPGMADWKPAPRGPGVALYMDIVGANPAARPVGQDEQPGKVNYFVGNDPAKWHSDIPTYGRVEYANSYSGISLAYYGGAGGLEYDFVVSPGADPQAIALDFRGAASVTLSQQGDLVVHTAAGDLVQHAPVLYQDVGAQRQPIPGRFNLDSFMTKLNAAGSALVYSTFLGGSGEDVGYGIALDGGGNVYLTGYTVDLPREQRPAPARPGPLRPGLRTGPLRRGRLALDTQGDLLVHTAAGDLVQHAPVL
jgi:hypothetical protein